MIEALTRTARHWPLVMDTVLAGRATVRRARSVLNARLDLLHERRRIESFRDLHRGDRCFVIGNGPSLRGLDLCPLAREKTFVVNHFYFHPQLADLRPSYYCVSDLSFFDPKVHPRWREYLERLPGSTTLFLPIELKRRVRASPIGARRNVYYVRCDRSCEIWRTGWMEVNASSVLATGDTVILDFCLPLAHFMGFAEVVLLGCDTDMGNGESAAHFYEPQLPSRSAAYHRDVWSGHVMRSYDVAARLFESTGRRIYNATAGGRLEVFPRISLEEALGWRPHEP